MPSKQRTANLQRETSAKYTNLLGTGDPLAIIYNEGMWKLNKISPLLTMQYSPVKLKMYASKAKQAIVGAVQASSARYTVTFEEQPNLKYSEDDSSGLLITVTSTIENSPRPKVVYTAVLLSWGERLIVDNATHLPYMLERGEMKVGTAVKSTLQHLFDCNIQQFTFTQHQLLQFGFYFVNSDPSRGTEQFTLGYKSPQVDHTETMYLSFDIADIQYIWNGVRGNQNSESVNLAYRVIQNQVFNMIKLDIITFDLSEVSLPKAQIKNKGTVKMKTPEIVNCVLTVLNEISSFISKDDP